MARNKFKRVPPELCAADKIRAYYQSRKDRERFSWEKFGELLGVPWGSLSSWVASGDIPIEVWQKFCDLDDVNETSYDVAPVCPVCGVVHARVCKPSFEMRLQGVEDGDKILKLFNYMARRCEK